MKGFAKITKTADIAKHLAKIRRVQEANLPRGLEEAGKILYDKSQELVPLDTLALKESGRLKMGGTGFDAIAYVGYGGEFGNDDGVLKTVKGKNGAPDEEVIKVPSQYAVYQHYMPLNHPNGGQSEYLEDAFDLAHLAMKAAIRESVGA